MSRNPLHRKRRIWCIWMPLLVVAVFGYFASFNYTVTLNGGGLVCMLGAFAGLVAIVKEGSTL